MYKLEYRLIGNGQVGKWHNLSTDDGGAFTALIFPDSQSSDYSGWQELAQNAAKRNPEAKFFVNMGDLVDNGEDHSQWFVICDSWFVICDSWFVICDSWFVIRDSWFVVRGSCRGLPTVLWRSCGRDLPRR